MTGLAVLLTVGLAAFCGWTLGVFRSAQAVGIVLVAGLVAFNSAGPAADALGSSDPGTIVGAVAVLFLAAAGFLGLFAWAISQGRVRVPWLMDRIGGACCGAAAGWLVAGIALSTVRTVGAFDDYIRNSRPEGEGWAFRYADGAWTQFATLASTRGLSCDPTIAYSPPHFVQKYKEPRDPAARGSE